MTMRLWYGKGPGECYVDSQEAAQMGVYRQTVDQLFTPYVKPQENGNRLGTRWVNLVDDRGIGLMVVGEEPLHFGAMYYEAEDLEKAKHTIDLVKRDYVVLTLDVQQNGLGSNSCGQNQLKKYRCTFKYIRLGCNLSLFNNKSQKVVLKGREMILKERKPS